MPRYLYQCPKCTDEVTIEARITDAGLYFPVCAACHLQMTRVFTVPFLVTQPVKFKDENKFALGFSESERTETRKKDDIEYAKHWNVNPKSL